MLLGWGRKNIPWLTIDGWRTGEQESGARSRVGSAHPLEAKSQKLNPLTATRYSPSLFTLYPPHHSPTLHPSGAASMSQHRMPRYGRFTLLIGFGAALVIAGALSPFASSNPDGLDRVSQDHGFDTRAEDEPIAHRLPFYAVFDEYALRGVPDAIATPLAGIVGTLVTFGLAWGAGKILVKSPDSSTTQPPDQP